MIYLFRGVQRGNVSVAFLDTNAESMFFDSLVISTSNGTEEAIILNRALIFLAYDGSVPHKDGSSCSMI